MSATLSSGYSQGTSPEAQHLRDLLRFYTAEPSTASKTKLLPPILSTCLRLIKRSVDVKAGDMLESGEAVAVSVLTDKKLCLETTAFLVGLFDVVSKSGAVSSAIRVILLGECRAVVTELQACLIQSIDAAVYSSKAIHSDADYEAIVDHSIDVLLAIDQFLLLDDRGVFLDGPILAQAIYVLLAIIKAPGKSNSKSQSFSAVKLLQSMISHAGSVNAWQGYLPGVFSSLFATILARSNLSHQAFLCIIRVLVLTCNDSQLSSIGNNDRHKNTSDLLASLERKANQSRSPSTISSNSLSLWREQLLQRLSTHLPKLFKTLEGEQTEISTRNTLTRASILKELALLMHSCSSFLGAGSSVAVERGAFVEFLNIIAFYVVDDDSAVNQSAVMAGDALSSKHSLWFRGILGELFVSKLTSLRSNDKSSLSTDLRVALGYAVLLGNAVGDVVRSMDPQLLTSSLISLFRCEALTESGVFLETKSYCSGDQTIVHRLAYSRPHGSIAYSPSRSGSSIRSLCILLGAHGASLRLVDALRLARRKCGQAEYKRSLAEAESSELAVSIASLPTQLVDAAQVKRDTKAEDSALESSLQDVMSVLSALSYSMLGLANFKVAHSSQSQPQPPAEKEVAALKCEVCGRGEETDVKLLRCSRCKVSCYCSSAHQKFHWPSHRPVCQPPMSGIQTSSAQSSVNSNGTAKSEITKLLGSRPEARSKTTHHSIESNSLITNLSQNKNQSAKISLPNELRDASDVLALGCLCSSENNPLVISIFVEVSDFLSHYISRPQSATATARRLAELCAIQSIDVLGHCGQLLGDALPMRQRSALYNLVCLSSEQGGGPIVGASSSTLTRWAMYLGHATTADLLRGHLDHLLDSVARALAVDIYTPGASDSRGETAFRCLEHVLDGMQMDSSSVAHRASAIAIIEDVIRAAIDSLDKYASTGLMSRAQAEGLLRAVRSLMMRVSSKPGLSEALAGLPMFKHRPALPFLRSFVSRDSPRPVPTVNVEGLNLDEIFADLNKRDLADALAKIHAFDLYCAKLSGQRNEDEVDEKVGQSEDEDKESEDEAKAGGVVEEVLRRCCHFLSMPLLGAQVAVLDTMAAGFLSSLEYSETPSGRKLSENQRRLYPLIHLVWPSLAMRLQELVRSLAPTPSATGKSSQRPVRLDVAPDSQGRSSIASLLISEAAMTGEASVAKAAAVTAPSLDTHSLLLPPLLDAFSLLASLAGDFTAARFKESVWPELLKTSASLAAGSLPHAPSSSSRFSLDSKLLISLLCCIDCLTRHPPSRVGLTSMSGGALLLQWSLIPWLGHEGEEVSSLALRISSRISKLWPSISLAPLRALSALAHQHSANPALPLSALPLSALPAYKQWRAVTYHPALKPFLPTSFADPLLSYLKNKALLTRVMSLVACSARSSMRGIRLDDAVEELSTRLRKGFEPPIYRQK